MTDCDVAIFGAERLLQQECFAVVARYALPVESKSSQFQLDLLLKRLLSPAVAVELCSLVYGCVKGVDNYEYWDAVQNPLRVVERHLREQEWNIM